MDWNKALVLIGQGVAAVILAALVATGHDGPYETALWAVLGALAGSTVYAIVPPKQGKQPPPND